MVETYFANMTYSHTTPPRNNTSQTASAVSRAARDHPNYIEDPRDIENLEGLRRQYSKLYDRFEGLEFEDSTDNYCRLSTALNATRKCYVETTEKAAAKDAKNAALSPAMSAEEREAKIQNICDIVSRFSAKDFSTKKLKRRAKQRRAEAKNHAADTDALRNNVGGEDDTAPLA